MKKHSHLNEKDHHRIKKLKHAKEHIELDALDKISDLDQKIALIQHSTVTSIPLFIPLHNSLRQRFSWYYYWHLKQISNYAHLMVLAIYCLAIISYSAYHMAFTSESTLAAPTTYTWIGDGDGSSWTDADNWDQGSGYPSTNTHKAVIDVESNSNITTPNSLTIASLEIGTNFNGTVTLGTGTITFSNTAESAEGNLVVNGGTLTAATNNPSIAIMGNFSIGSAGTFTKGSGTLTFSGESAKTFTDSNSTKQNLGIVTIGKTSSTASNNKITLASSMTVDTMTINSSNTLDLASSSYTLKLANSGSTATVLTVSGTLTPGTSTVEYAATNSSGNINVTTTTYSSLKFSGAETYDLTGNLTSTNALSGDITIDSGASLDVRPASTDYGFVCRDVIVNGTLDGTSSSATMEATRNWSHNNGTFNYGTTTVKLSGDGSLNSGDGKRFYNLQMAFSGKTTTLANSARVDKLLTTQSGTIATSVGWSGYIVFFGTGTVYETDLTTPAVWNAQTQASFWPWGNLTFTKARFYNMLFRCNLPGNCEVTLNGDLTIDNNLELRGGGTGKSTSMNTNGYSINATSGIQMGSSSDTTTWGKLNINSSTVTTNNLNIYSSNASGDNVLEFNGTSPILEISGNYSNLDILTANNGEIRFTKSSGTQTLDSGGTTASKAFKNLTHNGAGTLQLINNNIVVGGNFSQTAGTFDTNARAQTYSGNFTLASGTTYTKGGAVTFDGATDTTIEDATTSKQNLGAVSIAKTSNSPPYKVSLLSSATVDTLAIDANSNFDLGNSGYTLKLANAGSSANVFTNSGTLTPNSSSTVEYAATNSSGNVNILTTTYNNLLLSGAETYDLSGNLTSSNALTGNLTVNTGAVLDVRPASTDYNFTAVNVVITGTLDAGSSSSVMEASGNWTHSSGTFTRGSSTVKLTGDGNLDTSDAKGFHHLEFAYSTKTTTLINSVAVFGNITTYSGTIAKDASYRYISFFGSYTTDSVNPAIWDEVVAVWYGNTNHTLGKAHFYTLNYRGNTSSANSLTLNGSLTIEQDFILRGSGAGHVVTFETNSQTISVGRDIQIGLNVSTDRYSTFNLNGSTVNVERHVTIYASDASGDNSLNFSNSGILKLKGDMTINDVVSGSSGTMEFNGTSNQAFSTNGQPLVAITINNTGTAPNNKVTVSGNLDINGSLTVQSGNLDLNTNNPTVNFSGQAFTIESGGTFSNSNNQFIFDNTVAAFTQTISDNTSGGQLLGTLNISVGSTTTVSTSTNITAIALILSSGNTNISDDQVTLLSSSPISGSGAITTTGSTVVLTQSVTATTIPSIKFHSLSLQPTSANTFNLGVAFTGALAFNGDVTIGANATLATNNYDAEIGGSWLNSGVFSAGTSTITFTAITTGKTINGTLSGSSAFYNLGFNGSGGGWVTQASLEVNNNLSVTTGTLSSSANITVKGGSVTGNGVILASNTFLLDGTGDFGGDSAWLFSNLTFGDGVGISSTTKVGSGSISVSSVLTLASNQNLYASSSTWTLSGSGTPLSIAGNFYAQTSTFNYTATSATNVTGTTYHNLGVGTAADSAAVTYTAAMNMTITGVLTIGNSSSTATDNFSGSSRIITLSGSGTPLNITSRGNYTESTSTVNYTGTSATNITAETYYNLGIGTTADASAVTYSLTGNIVVTQILTLGNAGSSVNDTLSAGSYQISFSRTSGTPFTITSKGTLDPGTGTIRYYGNGSLIVAGTTYYNLTLDPTLTGTTRSYTFNAGATIANNLLVQPDDTASPYYDLSVVLGGNTSVSGTTTITRSNGATSGLNTSASSHPFTTGNLTINAGGTFIGNSSSVVVNSNISIASGATLSSTSGVLSVSGNFTNAGTFTANGGDVELTGGDSTTQQISGSTTFANLMATTSGNTAGRTIQFEGGSTQTVSGIFYITGYSSKLITLQSSNTTNWIINPTSADVMYVSVSRSTNSGVDFCAIYSTDGGNNTNWDITSSGSCNAPPNTPSMLAQMKTNDDTLTVGAWTNETSVKFTAVADDPDSSDTLYLCVEAKLLAQSFSNSEDACGSGVAYSGTPVTTTLTLTSLSTDNEYRWQVRIKDAAGAYSSWLSFGANAESERDFGIDTSAPTGGTVNDGVSADEDENDGTLDELHANWSGFSATVSGLAKYEYLVQRDSDSYYWNSSGSSWQSAIVYTNNSTSSSATVDPIHLQTSVKYIFGVRAHDNAGNIGDWVYSDGLVVQPFITFSVNSNNLAFANLNSSNSFTDSKTSILTTSTNAVSGYVVRAYKTALFSSGATTIADFYGTYASPVAWITNDYGFGYTSSDTNIQGSNKFSSGTLYAALPTGPFGDIVADYTATINGQTGTLLNDSHTITYRIAVSQTQAALSYATEVVYIVSAQF